MISSKVRSGRFLLISIQSAEGLWQIRCFLQHPVVNKALLPSGSCMPWFDTVKTRVATSNLTILHQNMKYESTYSTMVSVCQSAPQNEDPIPSPLCFGLEQMVPRNGVVVPRCHHTHRPPIYRVRWCRGTNATLCLTCFTYHFQCANPMARRKIEILRDSFLSTEDLRAASSLLFRHLIQWTTQSRE